MTKTNKIKKMNVQEAFFDMIGAMRNITINSCHYCNNKNYSYPSCPWFETGECNPAKYICRINNIFHI